MGFFCVLKNFVEKNDNVGHPTKGKMEDFKISIYEGNFNVTKSLGGWGYIWTAQPPLKTAGKRVFFLVNSFSPQ